MNLYFLVIPYFGLLGILSLVSFELLLYRWHNAHKMDWLRSGSPRLFFDSRNFGGVVARWSLGRKLILSTPGWVKSDRRGWLYLAVYRISTRLALASFFGLPILALLLS